MQRLIAASLLFLASDCSACECVKSSVESGMASSPLVFGASVTKAEISGSYVKIYISNFVPLKGEGRTLKVIRTPLAEGGCGFPVTVPGEYVFFVSEDGSFDRCGATRTLSDPNLGILANKVVNAWANRR